jgi:Histidine kinase-, DNA gyrase B-, and HSP90-like ATPase
VLDNGVGMPPHVLKTAIAFGGSMVYENRTGIGRYGMGMKAAALSMGPVMEVYSWQDPGMLYRMILDVSDIGNSRADLIELLDPQITDMLPSEVAEILCNPMVSPKNPESQELFAYDHDTVMERLGASGTIVYIPSCDRLTARRAQTLAEHATKDMARIYRRQLENGLRLFRFPQI